MEKVMRNHDKPLILRCFRVAKFGETTRSSIAAAGVNMPCDGSRFRLRWQRKGPPGLVSSGLTAAPREKQLIGSGQMNILEESMSTGCIMALPLKVKPA